MKNKTKESNWEERFDEEFTQKTDDYNNGQFLGYWQEIEICADDVKLFIQSEIDQALKSQLEQVEEEIPNLLHRYGKWLLENPNAGPLERRTKKQLIAATLQEKETKGETK